jgi:hypothetical protein
MRRGSCFRATPCLRSHGKQGVRISAAGLLLSVELRSQEVAGHLTKAQVRRALRRPDRDAPIVAKDVLCQPPVFRRGMGWSGTRSGGSEIWSPQTGSAQERGGLGVDDWA